MGPANTPPVDDGFDWFGLLARVVLGILVGALAGCGAWGRVLRLYRWDPEGAAWIACMALGSVAGGIAGFWLWRRSRGRRPI